MPIEFNCPHCGQFLRTPDEKAGLSANCPDCGMPVVVPPPELQASEGTDRPARHEPAAGLIDLRYEYAGFWLRFVASVFDVLILFFPLLLLACCVGEVLGPLVPFAFIFLGWPYFALLESSQKQATPGKIMARLAVIGEDGRRVTFAQASGRYFGKFLSTLPFFLGFVMAGVTRRKQALHDILAECLVIRKS